MSNKQKDSKWQKLKKEFYGTKTCVQSEYGTIDFDPDSMGDVVGGDKLTYDEYLDILMRSGKNVRGWFEMCYFETALEFAGQVEKINKDNICFKRIYVCGMFMDGECFDGKEDHVWMSKEGFGDCQVGDCFSFFAEVYRYLKTSNGKMIDFGLRNPDNIKKIKSYDLPSDDELLMQSKDQIICETCMFRDHCYGGMCIANKEWRDNMRRSMFEMAKGKKAL